MKNFKRALYLDHIFAQGDLALPLKLHREIAVLVLQAYVKFDNNGNEWSVSRGLNQVFPIFSYF